MLGAPIRKSVVSYLLFGVPVMSQESGEIAVLRFSDSETLELFERVADQLRDLVDFVRGESSQGNDHEADFSAVRSAAKLLLGLSSDKSQQTRFWRLVLGEALVRVEFAEAQDVAAGARYWAEHLASIARLGAASDPELIKSVSRFCLAVSRTWTSTPR